MALSSQQAFNELNALNGNGTVNQILDIVQRTDINVPNTKVTLLYAGDIFAAYNWEIAERGIGANNSDVATIGKTQAIEFVEDPIFQQELRNATNREGKSFNEVYSGKNAAGDRINNNGVFDIVSKNFAANASGDVRTISMNAESSSVFRATELPELLNNPSVTSIDGIPKAELTNIPINEAFDKIEIVSASNMTTLEIGYENGTGRITDATDATFFSNNPEVTDTRSTISADNIIDGKSLVTSDFRIADKLDILETIINPSTLNKLGTAGDIIATGIVLKLASDAFLAGDAQAAETIITDHITDMVNGTIGSIGALAVLGGALALTGVALPAGLVGLTIIAAVGIIGDIAGTELIPRAAEIFSQLQDELGDMFQDFSEWVGRRFGSPLTFDLEDNGLNLLSNENGVYFDIDNDGFAEKVGWVAPQDAILVRDLNNNGLVDNQTELFYTENGEDAWVQLSAYDNNNDGVVNGSDAAWGNLKLWRDLDSDGQTDLDELFTLESQGVYGIETTRISNVIFREGNKADGKGFFLDENGNQAGEYWDVFFDTKPVDSFYVGSSLTTLPSLDFSTLSLPLSRGYGDVEALHYAMTNDGSLKTMVSNLANADIDSAILTINQSIQDIIVRWAGDPAVDADNNTIYFNAKVESVIEGFAGTAYDFGGGSTQAANAGQYWQPIFSELKARFLVQGTFSDIFEGSYYDFTSDSLILNGSVNDILNRAISDVPLDTEKAVFFWSEIGLILQDRAAQFNQTELQIQAAINGAAGKEITIFDGFLWAQADGMRSIGEDGNDYFIGSVGNDTLLGEGGNDLLKGLSGQDSIVGDFGNDTAYGGDGNDTLQGSEGVDYLDGGNGNDLIRSFRSGNSGTFDGDVLIGGTGNDSLYGDNGIDTIYGGTGNDLIDGNGDNDLIYGDVGADTISTGNGNDIIAYTSLADSKLTNNAFDFIQDFTQGQDKIDVSAIGTFSDVSDFTVTYETNDTFLKSGSFTIEFDGVYTFTNNDFIFTTGSGGGGVNINGTNGNDNLVGSEVAQIIKGFNGNDTITGDINATATNEDTVFGGNGNDNIQIWNGIAFGNAGNDLVFGGNVNDSLYGGDGSDTVKGNKGDDYIDGEGGNDKLYGKDGNDFIKGNIGLDLIDAGIGDDTVAGNAESDTVYGQLGNDYIDGGSGNDLIAGGSGADTIVGGSGSDTFLFFTKEESMTTGGNIQFDVIEDFQNGNDIFRLPFLSDFSQVTFYHNGSQNITVVETNVANSDFGFVIEGNFVASLDVTDFSFN